MLDNEPSAKHQYIRTKLLLEHDGSEHTRFESYEKDDLLWHDMSLWKQTRRFTAGGVNYEIFRRVRSSDELEHKEDAT